MTLKLEDFARHFNYRAIDGTTLKFKRMWRSDWVELITQIRDKAMADKEQEIQDKFKDSAIRWQNREISQRNVDEQTSLSAIIEYVTRDIFGIDTILTYASDGHVWSDWHDFISEPQKAVIAGNIVHLPLVKVDANPTPPGESSSSQDSTGSEDQTTKSTGETSKSDSEAAISTPTA